LGEAEEISFPNYTEFGNCFGRELFLKNSLIWEIWIEIRVMKNLGGVPEGDAPLSLFLKEGEV
jgi:hypothetical protein